MNKIKSTILLVIVGILFLSIYSCCSKEDEKVKLQIIQEVSLTVDSHMAIRYGEDYRVKTCLIARWKKCYTWSSITHHRHLRILLDWVKCEDIVKTKKDQMEEILRLKNSIEECIKINPDLIINY